jgi:hypothetical protein
MANHIVCTPAPRSGGQRAGATSVDSAGGMGGDSASVARRLIDAASDRTADARSTVIAVVKANAWGKRGERLTTSFMDNPSAELRREILKHLNMWSKRANVEFVESSVDPMVRIDRRTGPKWGGYWSYVGTEILGIPADEPTMNFEGFTMTTTPSEFRRVVCHEAGHTLGFPHEHMRNAFVQRIDPEKAYAYFQRTDGWSRRDVDEQVLTPLSAQSIIGTRADQTSIMCYQLPGSIMTDGKPILGGTSINETDYRFAAELYPLPRKAPGKATSKRKAKKSAAKKGTGRRTAKGRAKGSATASAKRRATKRGSARRA